MKRMLGMHPRARLLSLVLLMGACFTSFAREDSEEEPAFEFDKQAFYLRSNEGGILEYLPAGETFEKWNTLFSIREFSGTDNPKLYAQKLLDNAKASGPDVRGVLMENEAAGSYIVDFLVFSAEGESPAYGEWNVWRVEKKGEGVQAVQYARRFYAFDEDSGKEIAAAREKIVPELAEFGMAKSGESAAHESTEPAASAAEMQTYTYPDAESPQFAMDVPAEWHLEGDDKGAWIVSADKLFTTSVVVVDAGDTADATESIKKQSGGRFESVEWGDPMDKTDEATGLIFSATEGLAEAKGVKHKVGVYAFSKKDGEKAFILSTWTPEAAVSENAEGFMKMFSSVKLE